MNRISEFDLTGARDMIMMPDGAQILAVYARDNRVVTLCALTDDAMQEEQKLRAFRIVGPGETVNHGEIYVGTVNVGWSSWHVFERTNFKPNKGEKKR